MCGMVKPSFIPPADIRELKDLVRYRFKLTCMVTSEKNRAHNCLTVSNLKLDDVFSDIFGKSSRSITEQILQHPGETFDVAPFVDGRCKTPIEEIFVYTPKHSSWMNQIEIWFGIINRKLLKRKSYLSTEELEASILRFIEQYNLTAHPFKWTYAGIPLAV